MNAERVIFCQKVPDEQLAPYVAWFWFFDGLDPSHRREHVLPDGTFELIIDLREEPRRLFDREDPRRDQIFRRGWISGAHSQYIVIDALPQSSMIGVHFKPGGASAILGLPADVLRDQVVELEDLWGAPAAELRDQLLAACTAQLKFRVLESFLIRRLAAHPRDAAQQRRIFHARDLFAQKAEDRNVRAVADRLGMSHKHFISEFRRHVGLTPKLFCRIQRFQQVLGEIAARRNVEWADVACSCGYFDQAHFVHDFQRFSGLNPSTYVVGQPEYSNFVPVDETR